MNLPTTRAALALALFALAGPALAAAPAASPEAVAAAALKAAPVWDGHNDVPEQLRDRRSNVIAGFDFTDTTATADPAKNLIAMHTDLARLRKGRVGAQFWSVYVSASLPEPQAVQATLEQIDVMKRLIAANPGDMQFCTDSACVESAMKQGRIASLLGMEGGHSIGGSLAVLRQMYALGARYMTLTHSKNNAWADASTDKPVHNGLTPLGKDMVRDARYFSLASRICAENGANIVKTYYTEGFEKVVACCPVPIVIAGAKKLPELEALELAYMAIQSGASGVDMGRNVFQSEKPAAMIQAVSAVVHKNMKPADAFQMFNDL